jgi:hypothetical protein
MICNGAQTVPCNGKNRFGKHSSWKTIQLMNTSSCKTSVLHPSTAPLFYTLLSPPSSIVSILQGGYSGNTPATLEYYGYNTPGILRLPREPPTPIYLRPPVLSRVSPPLGPSLLPWPPTPLYFRPPVLPLSCPPPPVAHPLMNIPIGSGFPKQWFSEANVFS